MKSLIEINEKSKIKCKAKMNSTLKFKANESELQIINNNNKMNRKMHLLIQTQKYCWKK